SVGATPRLNGYPTNREPPGFRPGGFLRLQVCVRIRRWDAQRLVQLVSGPDHPVPYRAGTRAVEEVVFIASCPEGLHGLVVGLCGYLVRSHAACSSGEKLRPSAQAFCTSRRWARMFLVW